MTTFVRQFARYRYARLPFGTAPVGDMEGKRDEIFNELNYVLA